MMFAKRKLRQERIGWIVKIACKTSNASFEKWFMPILKHQYVWSFISCWDEKYRSNVIRPETVINQYIDENWKPALQTRRFPNIQVGILWFQPSHLISWLRFWRQFLFLDDSDYNLVLPNRSFKSFNEASRRRLLWAGFMEEYIIGQQSKMGCTR
jgi:hypothetical protein